MAIQAVQIQLGYGSRDRNGAGRVEGRQLVDLVVVLGGLNGGGVWERRSRGRGFGGSGGYGIGMRGGRGGGGRGGLR